MVARTQEDHNEHWFEGFTVQQIALRWQSAKMRRVRAFVLDLVEVMKA